MEYDESAGQFECLRQPGAGPRDTRAIGQSPNLLFAPRIPIDAGELFAANAFLHRRATQSSHQSQYRPRSGNGQDPGYSRRSAGDEDLLPDSESDDGRFAAGRRQSI